MAASAASVKSKKTFGQWFRSRKVQQWLVIITFMFVPVLLLLIFSYVPFAKMFEFSLYKMKSYDSKNNVYIGFKNYVDVFTRDDCFNSLKLAGYYIVASFVQLALALYFATILCFKVRGSSLFKGLIFFPYLISGIAIGFIFKFFYTRGFVLDTVLSWIGLNPESLPYWLKDTRINNASLAATSVWRYMGQNMVLFLGAMMSVDPCLYEAASIDGANAWPKFRYIMLPSIKSVIVLNMILSISGSLSAFEPPYVITGGTFGTATYFVMMNSLAHEKGKIGLAAAMAVVLMGLIFIVTIFQQVVMKLIDEYVWIFIKYFSLILAGFIAVLPVVSCVITALKTPEEYASTNVMKLPSSLYFKNFTEAFEKANMGVAFINSLIILVVVLFFSIMFGAMLAYVLNRFTFPGRGLIRNLFLFASLLPGIAMQVTVYKIMYNMHLINSIPGYIILLCGTDIISVTIFIQFFENLPNSLDESAIMDGCTYFGVFFKILLPLLKPAIVTVMILKGVGTYNEYYMANLYLQDKSKLVTVATSLYKFTGPLGNQYNYICAGVIITLLPALIIFILCQKQIYGGLAAGSVKG